MVPAKPLGTSTILRKIKILMEPNYNELKRYLTLAENQLSSKTSANALIQDFFWLDDANNI